MKKKPKLKLSQILIVSLILIYCALSGIDKWQSSRLMEKMSKSIVFIRSPEGAAHQGSATGFEVKAPSGAIYTLTNAHVCGLEKDGVVMIEEKLHSGRLIPKRIIEVFSDNDLCLVEGLAGYEGLSLASSYEMGDLNYAIGYPLGESINISSGFLKQIADIQIPLPEIANSDCKGPNLLIGSVQTIFGPIEMCFIKRNAIQTNIPIYPGNSGSPMFNASGQVTGVIFASNRATAWGSAVPLESVISFLSAY